MQQVSKIESASDEDVPLKVPVKAGRAAVKRATKKAKAARDEDCELDLTSEDE